MPRPRKVERKDALTAAAELFWRQGYATTSMRNLLEATGMGQGSFYDTFQAKERLFEEVLSTYGERVEALLLGLEEAHGPLATLEQFMIQSLVEVGPEQRLRGCLVVNTILEMEGVDDRLHALAVGQMGRLRKFMQRQIRRANRAGELKPGLSEVDASHLLLTLIEGLRVESRRNTSARRLATTIHHMFDLIRRERGGDGST